MEQRLDATYLRRGLVERTAAVGIGAVCIGTGILLRLGHFFFVALYASRDSGTCR